ncbi:hypothetical protein [Streptomyces sp. NPDC001056]
MPARRVQVVGGAARHGDREADPPADRRGEHGEVQDSSRWITGRLTATVVTGR